MQSVVLKVLVRALGDQFQGTDAQRFNGGRASQNRLSKDVKAHQLFAHPSPLAPHARVDEKNGPLALHGYFLGIN